ncbi:hypothetical protein ElyMa_006881900 [Elysia marginata]|uniref:Uncharacterized protein n=1 Tax=Elysia marginata TaxID=1093978 RepID=A0AAV4JEA2_9GAST|nr:hypothetical protein ElyMa_006881900 [Elysia marginata]
MNITGVVVALVCLFLPALRSETTSGSDLPKVSVETRNPNGVEKRTPDVYRALGWLSDFDCLRYGRWYSREENYNLPGFSECLKYRCIGGRIDYYKESCEMDGQCHAIGSYFERDCVMYRCDKLYNGRYRKYESTVFTTRCVDAQGKCRQPGETFARNVRGKYFPHCGCQVLSPGFVKYHCINQ